MTNVTGRATSGEGALGRRTISEYARDIWNAAPCPAP